VHLLVTVQKFKNYLNANKKPEINNMDFGLLEHEAAPFGLPFLTFGNTVIPSS